MHPALSIIFFTVTSGLGYGWVVIALVLDLSAPSAFPDPGARVWSGILALVLITAGLLSSTMHLANPKNAWRAVVRVRTSWLSREAVLSLVFYPVFVAYLVLAWRGESGPAMTLFGGLSVLVALATLFSTAMIYACLRTIRQWRTPFTPLNFTVIALALGGLAHLAYRSLVQPPVVDGANTAVMLLLLLAFSSKLAYYLEIGLPPTQTISTATGFRMATVRLLDVGHTAGTFLTDEFGYQVSRPMIVLLRVVSLAAGLAVPALIVVRSSHLAPLVGAALLGYAGALVERWLFFAEAQHVVRLYHGQAET